MHILLSESVFAGSSRFTHREVSSYQSRLPSRCSPRVVTSTRLYLLLRKPLKRQSVVSHVTSLVYDVMRGIEDFSRRLAHVWIHVWNRWDSKLFEQPVSSGTPGALSTYLANESHCSLPPSGISIPDMLDGLPALSPRSWFVPALA